MPLAEINGVALFHDVIGPQGAPVVVFANSIGTTLEMWDAQAAALSGRYRVVRFDARGHGRSPVVDAPASIDMLAADLAGLLDALGITRAHVVGLSLGGMTAQAFAAAHPERVHGLLLMATAAYLPGDWAARAKTVREGTMAAIVDAVMGRWFTPAFQTAPQALELRRRFLEIDPRGYAVCCGVIEGLDLRPALGRIAAPTLIIAGAEDQATPPALSMAMRDGIARAELLVLPQAAHILAVEQAATVNRHLLRFLDEWEHAPSARSGKTSS